MDHPLLAAGQLNRIQLTLRPILVEVSVIIPTLGRPILEACLAALAAGSVWPVQIIVVDQGNNPAVASWLSQLQQAGLKTVHLRSAQRGAAAARNRAIERVQTARVAAIDDDCLPQADWLENMAACFQRHPEAVITGRVQPVDGSLAPSTNVAAESIIYRHPLLKYDPLYTGNMGFPQRASRQVGLFDESELFCAAEDNDWGYRLLRAGFAIVYAPEVVVTHMDWRTPAQMAAVYRKYARGQGVFYGKYLRRGDGFMAHRAVRDALRGPWRWLRGLLKKDADMRASGRAYTLHLLPGVVAGFRGQR